jgi:hypothetical protein
MLVVMDFTYLAPFLVHRFNFLFQVVTRYSGCIRRIKWGRAYLGISYDFILVKLMNALAWFFFKRLTDLFK